MPLKAISLFTGVGGLDFGFEAAGFETAVALDFDSTACRVLRLNRPWPVIEGDITATKTREILDTAGLQCGDADILIGGPPCQPFSKSGYWVTGDAKRLDDPRARTLGHYFRILRETLPKTFLLENVPGIAYRGKSEGLDIIRRELDKINEEMDTSYSIEVEPLNAANYGVPQLRERVFVVGSRDGLPFKFPERTHASPDEIDPESNIDPYMTAWDAIGGLPSEFENDELAMSGKWADLLPTIPEGRNYLWHTDRGGGAPLFGWRRRYWSFLLKLSKTLPSWTIQAQPGPATGPFHWKNRRLSAAELARLQTFPENLVFDCRHVEAQKLIGNAVPSALAELLALEIHAQLLDGLEKPRRPSLLPRKRSDEPDAEPVRPLPRKYRSMIGTHEKHPGTGLGWRATARPSKAA